MSDGKFVTLEDALDVLREQIAYVLEVLADGEEITALRLMESYDESRSELLEHAREAESPADSRRIWIDQSGAIIVAIRDFTYPPERRGWLMYAVTGESLLSKRVDGDPGDIGVPDARRLVGLGGYV